MIKKNDILMYAECVEDGDDACLMLAIEDETTHFDVSYIRVVELNTTLSIPPVNYFESKCYKVVGHANDTDKPIDLVKTYLPKDKWRIF